MTKKLREYSILTTGSNRLDVKAYDVTDAYRKARQKLISFNKSSDAIRFGMSPQDLTASYMTFGKDGINMRGWISSKSSEGAYRRFRLGIPGKEMFVKKI